MITLYTFTLPGPEAVHRQMVDDDDSEAVRRLQERLDEDREDGEEKVTVTADMISEREERVGLDEFLRKYQLVPANEGSGEPMNCLWETYGEELAFVQAAQEKDPKTIWTLIEEDGISFILPGARFVNRLGYFVTTTPRESDDESYLYSD